MTVSVGRIFDDPALRMRILSLLTFLIGMNLLAWGWALVSFREYPVLIGTALLAWSFGLRHAVDADHIAAIDNVTRKLMQDGKKPIGVGLCFSLGHSTIVVLATIAVAATATAFKDRIEEFHSVGGIVGTSVSAVFLLLIALINIVILQRTYRTFRQVKAGRRLQEDCMDDLLSGGGYLTAILRPAFRLVTRSWHMYPLGILFGLGFDTATEVGLLGVAAAEASKGLDIWSIMVFPALFAAGMSLIDTLDSILMLGAYGWAFVKPIRKLYYNMTITGVSVIVALVVGGVEALGLIGAHFHLTGPVWDAIGALNENLGNIGFLIIGIFVGTWLISFFIYRSRGYDYLEYQRSGD
ncbi:HoxN/HupN/NixA family nickel/cobalt transporter [Allgaiera indica]|nr:HoxN/HupN/NixA family nickel/cobalt transporter [Allgaiera indica]